MAKDKTKVSVVILTLNNCKLIEEELSLFKKLDTQGLIVDLVIIDNGSTDETSKLLKNTSFKNINFKVITNTKNLGFATGNNQGINYSLKSKPDYILLLNDDMVFETNFLNKLVNFANKNKEYSLISPKIYFAKGHEFHKGRYKENEKGKVIWYAGGTIDWDNIYTSHDGVDEVDKGQRNKLKETDVASGACLLIRREVIEKIGGLDDNLFLYWEDAEYTQRAKQNGFKAVYYPEVSLHHKVSIAAGGSGSPSNDYFLIRNRYYFSLKYAKSLRTKFAVFRDTIKLMFFGSTWQKIGARDGLLGLMGRGSWKK